MQPHAAGVGTATKLRSRGEHSCCAWSLSTDLKRRKVRPGRSSTAADRFAGLRYRGRFIRVGSTPQGRFMAGLFVVEPDFPVVGLCLEVAEQAAQLLAPPISVPIKQVLVAASDYAVVPSLRTAW